MAGKKGSASKMEQARQMREKKFGNVLPDDGTGAREVVTVAFGRIMTMSEAGAECADRDPAPNMTDFNAILKERLGTDEADIRKALDFRQKHRDRSRRYARTRKEKGGI